MDNTLDQFTRDALHLAGHTDEQIEAMRAKAAEDAKPKPVVIIPWVPIPAEKWAQHEAEENAKRAAAKVKRAHDDRLAHEKAATAEAVEEAETWKKRANVERDRYAAMMKQQHRR
jgi:hypothetical protein